MQLMSPCLSVAQEWPFPTKIQFVVNSSNRLSLLWRTELVPNGTTAITTKRRPAKKYTVKDGNPSTSKDLILDARIHPLWKPFLPCHQAVTSLTRTLIFSTSTQKCVKILIWVGWCPALCHVWGSVPAGGGTRGVQGREKHGSQLGREKLKEEIETIQDNLKPWGGTKNPVPSLQDWQE